MNSAEKQIYRFADVEVDIARGCVRRDGAERHLRRKTFEVLVYLLEQRERIVGKEELMKGIWRDTAVTDDTLVQCVKEIRRTLGDDSHQPRFIKTVSKVGYRFIGSVEEIFNTAQIIETVHAENDQTFKVAPPAAPLLQNNPVLSENVSETILPQWKTQHAAMIFISSLVLIIAGLSVSFAPNLWQSAASSSEFSLPQKIGKKSVAVMYFENQTDNAELDYPGAIQAFREIINRYPSETEAYWRLAKLQAGEEKMDEAVETLKQGLAVDAEAKDIYNTLGNTLSAMGRHDEARAAHERYVALAPVEPNAYDSLGLTHQSSGDYAVAIANYNRALELNPKFEVAIIHLANTRFQLGQYQAAIDLYRRYIAAAKSDKERLRGLECIVIVYLRKHDYESAEKVLNEARKISKEPSWISHLIALERGKNIDLAEFEKFFPAKSPFNDRGVRNKQRFDFYLRGLYALKTGKTGEAINNFKEAVRRPLPIWNIDSYEDCLANALLQNGQIDEAAAEYERILLLNPNYPLARFHLAQTFERKHEIEKAKDFYRQFLAFWNEADADVPEIIEAKRFLDGS